ncbi:MAG: flagellar type III secretion system pore protein FliP [Acidaminobacteraceae bacterium]
MKKLTIVLLISLMLIMYAGFTNFTYGEGDFTLPTVDISLGGEAGENPASTVQIIVLLTVLSIAPSILIMMTSFTRIIIIFSFLRKALSLQTTPPNQVIIALALFLTFFVMRPTFDEININAYQPFAAGEITQAVALEETVKPLKTFMLRQVRTKDLALFADIAGIESIENFDDVTMTALIPAFMISELKTGFEVGFLLFMPFIVIDMIVASTLMALGMVMLPPVMIAMPFKILLFVLVDGWNLIVEKIVLTIR